MRRFTQAALECTSLGPAAVVSFLGEDGAELGRRQDFLIAVDALRFKLALNDGRRALRPFLFVGGGFYYASLPLQQSAPMQVTLADGTPAALYDRCPHRKTTGTNPRPTMYARMTL